MRKMIPILLAVAIVLLVGGWGSSGAGSKPLSKSDYEKQLTTIGKGLSGSIGALGSATSAKAAATALATLQVRLRSAVKQLNSIKPPSDIKPVHQQLVRAAGGLADELGPVITKIKAGNLHALSSLTTLKGLKKLLAVDAALTKAGYEIQLAGSG